MFCAICFFPPFLLAVLASVANASCPSGNDPNCAWGKNICLGSFLFLYFTLCGIVFSHLYLCQQHESNKMNRIQSNLTYIQTLPVYIVPLFQWLSSCPEPFNPYSCGDDLECPYNTRCDAEAAGYNIENDCCQSPQPSACGLM